MFSKTVAQKLLFTVQVAGMTKSLRNSVFQSKNTSPNAQIPNTKPDVKPKWK